MKTSGCFTMFQELINQIMNLRAQTREVVTFLLKECSVKMESDFFVLNGIKKQISLFGNRFAFDTETGKFYEICQIPGKEIILRSIENEELEVLIQKTWFMNRLIEICEPKQ
ncbi:MAG: hypothetical protein WC842_02550 [Candidatus Paceibacterota bacterium]